MHPYALSIKNLTVTYAHKPVLWNLHADIPQGIMLALVGPNGAGKSTLIKTIVNLIKPAAGVIQVLGNHYLHQRQHVAYIPQRASIDWDFPLHVLDVVIMGCYGQLGWFARPTKKHWDNAYHALEKVGLLAQAHTPINQLSCGQQQRVFLARALMHDALLYLMDEPFVGVDAVTEKNTVALLQELRQQGKTIIMVHHDLHTIADYFDWLMLLNTQIITCGPLEISHTQELLQRTYYAKMPIHLS